MSDPYYFYRFDGPAIGQVPDGFFTSKDSNNKIIGFVEKTKGTTVSSVHNIRSRIFD